MKGKRDETIEEARRRAEAFSEELERLTKRYQPRQFAPSVATILHKVLGDQSQWARYPPHTLVNAIEANCAYFRGHRDLQLSQNRFDQIINHYKDYYDPYLKYVIRVEKSADLFALALSREQFDLQRRPNLDDFARTLLLYEVDDPIPGSSSLFKNQRGISVNDWIYMCFAVQSHVMNRPSPLVKTEDYTDSIVSSIPRESVPAFLEHVSAPPASIGEHFRSERSKYPAHFHIFIKSAFFTNPLIAFEDGQYLVIHPNLIFYHADQGLYDSCFKLNQDVFAEEFGKSFENYIRLILGEFFTEDRIHSESELQPNSAGRTCDFLVDDEDCVILIECKATRHSSDLLTENAILHDNSTGKIADAFEQLHSTAARVANGDFRGLIGERERPIVGLVAMYGELYFANSDTYFEKFISEILEQSVLEDWPNPLAHSPQIMRVGTLESFLVFVRERKVSPLKLIEEKLRLSYIQTGDWQSYLGSISQEIQNWSIPILDHTARTYFSDVIGL